MDNKNPSEKISYNKYVKIIVTSIIVILMSTYIVGILSGGIDEKHRIDGIALSIILVTLLITSFLWWPRALSEITHLKLGNFFEINRNIKRLQDNQEHVRLILPLLLPEYERNHLVNLLRNNTRNYKGGLSLRNELRHLRSIGLIEMCNNHRIRDTRNLSEFNLARYVKLTKPAGRHWAEECKKFNSKLERSDNSEITH